MNKLVNAAAPTVTINQKTAAPAQADPTTASPIVFTVVFSEIVTGFDDADIDFTGSTAGGTLVASVTGTGAAYEVEVTGMTSSGTVVASIPVAAAQNGAMEASLASTSSDNSVQYNTIPTVTINQKTVAPAQADPTTASPIVFTVVFSETVTGFDGADIDFTGSTAGGTLAASVSGAGAAYEVEVTGMTTSGTVVASIPAAAAQSTQTVDNLASTSSDNSVQFNSTPSVTINQKTAAPAQADPTTASPIVFTVVFSESVTGFDGADITFTGSTAGGTLSAAVTGSGANYEVQVTGMTTSGTVVASIPAAAALSAQAVGNLASTSSDNSVQFNSVPSVTINQKTTATAQDDPTNASPILFTVIFSESVTGFTGSDISFTGSTVGGTLSAGVTGSGAAYEVSVTGMTTPGTVVVSIPASVAQNGGMVGNAASTSSDNSVYYDGTAPVLNVSSPLSPADNAINVSPGLTILTVTFDEDIMLESVTPVNDNEDEIRIFDTNEELAILKSNTTVLTTSGNQLTIDLSTTGFSFASGTSYNVRIGNAVIQDLYGNTFAGWSGSNSTWNFTTSSLSIIGPNQTLCTGSDFVYLDDIIIEEASNSDFAVGNDQSFFLSIPSGFEFEPGAGDVSITGGNISNASVTVTSTKVILFYSISSPSNSQDRITITGLKARPTGGAATGDILRTGGDAVQSGNAVADAKSHGTLTSVAGNTLTFNNDATANSICVGEDITFNAAATGTSNFAFYVDGILAQTGASANFTPSPVLTDGQVVSVQALDGTCQQAAEVTITVNPLPVADAGSPLNVCAGENVILGGSPILSTTTTGPYTYTWTGVSFDPSDVANPTITAPDPGVSDAAYTYDLVVTDANLCSSATSTQTVNVKNINQSVAISQPSSYNFYVNQDTVLLAGEPATNGVFSGSGVIQLSNMKYAFDPELAGTDNSPHTVYYTATLDNGCSKTISQPFYVNAAYNAINNLEPKYCDDEGLTGVLTLDPTFQSQIVNYINTWNTVYAPNYGYGPLAPFNPSDPNLRNYYGTGVVKSGSNYRFDPGNITKPCPTCNYAYVGVFLKFSTANYYPYNTPEFFYGGEFITVNPVPDVEFTGLESGLANPLNFCNIDEDIILTANAKGGKFYIDNVEAGLTPNDGLEDPDGTGPQAIFNPLEAGLGPHTIRFEQDPGTEGSTGQACIGSFQVNVTVIELPNISFNGSTPPNSTIFCYNDAPETLMSSEVTNVVYSGLGVTNSTGGTGTFNPTQAYLQREVELGTALNTPQDFTISVTYTNAQGCQNTDTRSYQVRPLPAASFDYGTKSDFCYEDAPVNFNGANPSGRYEVYYVRQPALPNALLETDNDNQYTFDPAAIFQLAVDAGASELSTPTIRVVYTTNDPVKTSCTNAQVEDFTIAPTIPVDIAGVDDGEVFCANEGARTLTMSPGGGIFSINGISTSLTGGQTYILDRSPDGGTLELEYVLFTGTGCSSTITKTINILPSPQATFNAPPQCDGDEVQFQSLNNLYAEKITWILGDNTIDSGSVAGFAQITHQYASPNQYYVKLVLEGSSLLPLTCVDSTDQFVTIGGIPEASFDFSKVCQGELTEFIGTSTNNTFLASYSWDFGDGDVLPEGISTDPIPAGTHGGKTTGTYANPIHQYDTDGTYSVHLVGKSQTIQGACPDEEIRELSILKNVSASSSSPYAMVELNGEDGFWKVEDLNNNSTWEFGQPSGSQINATDLAWETNLTGSYLSNDQSYVNSPCFDLSAINRPVVSLDYWSDTQRESDGAVLQYSTDGGFSWQTLGSAQNGVSTGLNWYNQSGITGNPGGQNLFGWSRAGDSDWTNARHALDVIPLPRDNVRLRIAFGSNGDTELEGFAFKDVRVEDRNKVVLMEHFTNEGTPTAADSYVRSFGVNSSEIIKLEYRTDFPQVDARNEANKADNNSRVAYYGITNSPTTLIDGQGESSLISSGWGDLLFSQKTLVTSPFSISSNTSIEADDLVINVNITADAPVLEDNSILHVVLAERDANTAEYVYNMMKMLPNAAGTKLNSGLSIAQGESFNLMFNTTITEAIDPSLSAIIVFVQNEDTGDVYQAEVNSLMALPPVVTSLDQEPFDGFGLFPNPANDQVTILFNEGLQNSTLRIYDNFGKLIFNKAIDAPSLTLSTQDFASGMYHVQVSNDDDVIRKRLIITHSDH